MSIIALYKVNVVLVVKNHTTQFSFLLIYEKKINVIPFLTYKDKGFA